MRCVVVASLPIDANWETLDGAAGRPVRHEAVTDSKEPYVRAWDFGEDRAEAEQAVTRLNNIPGVSATIREDSDEPAH